MTIIITGLIVFMMKKVFMLAILRASSRRSPYPGSTSNSPFKKLNVFSDMCTRLKTQQLLRFVKKNYA